MKRVYITQDGDGHNYVIPYEDKEKFEQQLQLIDSLDEFDDEDEYYKQLDIFETAFGQYATGGDVNLVELYTNIN